MIRVFRKIVFGVFLIAIVTATGVFSQATLPAPKQEKLLNGLKVLMWPDAKADKVSIKIRIHSGSAFDPQGKEGLMQMLADNLFPNVEARDFFTEDLGGGLWTSASYHDIEIDASSDPEKLLTMLETLSAAVSNPVIDKETTDKLRGALLANVAKSEADPMEVADQAIAKRLFGTFPYGRPRIGTAESLKKILFTDLTDAKQRFLTADNATIAISGNFDKSSAMKAIRRYFGGWIKSDKLIPATFRQPDDPPTEMLVVPWPKPDVFLMRFAIRGPARGDKDIPASIVFSQIIYSRIKALTGESDVNVEVNSYALPGRITFFVNHSIDVQTAARLFAKSLSDQFTEAEFTREKAVVLSNRPSWLSSSMKGGISFWLDADTYKISTGDAAIQNLNTITFGEVNAYAERARKLPVASVVVQSVPTVK